MFRKISLALVTTLAIGIFGMGSASASITQLNAAAAGYGANDSTHIFSYHTVTWTEPSASALNCSLAANKGTQISVWGGLGTFSDALSQAGTADGCTSTGLRIIGTFAVITGATGAAVDPQGTQSFNNVTVSPGDNLTMVINLAPVFGVPAVGYALTDNTTGIAQTIIQTCPSGFTGCVSPHDAETIVEPGTADLPSFGTINFTHARSKASDLGNVLKGDVNPSWNSFEDTMTPNFENTPICATPSAYTHGTDSYSVVFNAHGCGIAN